METAARTLCSSVRRENGTRRVLLKVARTRIMLITCVLRACGMRSVCVRRAFCVRQSAAVSRHLLRSARDRYPPRAPRPPAASHTRPTQTLSIQRRNHPHTLCHQQIQPREKSQPHFYFKIHLISTFVHNIKMTFIFK